MPSLEMLKKAKLSLLLRLLDNEYTMKVVENILKESQVLLVKDSLINDIIEIAHNNIDDLNDLTIDTLKIACTTSLNELLRNYKHELDNNELVTNIRDEFLNENLNHKAIEELLKCFDQSDMENGSSNESESENTIERS